MASSISTASKQENSEIGREAKFVDCEQSVFSLKIRRVLRHGAFWHRERFKPKRDWGEARRLFFPRLGLTPSFLAASPLAAARPTPATLKKIRDCSRSTKFVIHPRRLSNKGSRSYKIGEQPLNTKRVNTIKDPYR